MRPLKIILFGIFILLFVAIIVGQHATYACDGGGETTRIVFRGDLNFEEIILGSKPFQGTLQIREPWIERNLVLGTDKIIVEQVIVPSSKIPINNKITLQSANIEPIGAIKYHGKTLIIEKAKVRDCADVEKVARYRTSFRNVIKRFFSPRIR